MVMIADDPIISCMEHTGLPPWLQDRPRRGWYDDQGDYLYDEEDDFGGDGETYYGNETSWW